MEFTDHRMLMLNQTQTSVIHILNSFFIIMKNRQLVKKAKSYFKFIENLLKKIALNLSNLT